MFVVYDLETTGLSTTADDIVQFSYIRFDNNNMPVQAENLYFYYEGMHWSKEAEDVHHIPLEFVKQYADKFEENVIKMYSIMSLSNVVGFNSESFDNVFVRNWLSRMGMTDVQLGIQKDIMLLARPVVHKSRISLVHLCERLGITPDIIRSFESLCYKNEGTQAHNGSYDVAATALCALKFMREGYLTWKFGKTDVKADDVFGDDVATDDFMNPPNDIDPDIFWVFDGELYNPVSISRSSSSTFASVSEEEPVGNVLYPCLEKVGYGRYPFNFCELYKDADNVWYVKFSYGTFKLNEIPFDKLLEQLKIESSERCVKS